VSQGAAPPRRRSIRYVTGQRGAARPDDLPPAAPWIALGVLVVFVLLGLGQQLPHEALVPAIAAAVALGAGVAMVRTRPPLQLGWAVVGTAAVALLGGGVSSNVAWFAICVTASWCVLTASRWQAVGYWLAALALFGAEWAWAEHDPGWGAWMAGTSVSAFAALVVRHELALVRQLRAAQAGLAERARAEERGRIARELHDVIAHTLTVSQLHVTSARLAVQYEDRDEAERALAEAERLGQQCLAEVRATVGLLRDGGRPAATTPLPGASALPELIEGFRLAGATVQAQNDGDLAGLPATTGLAIYRIVQEALTNATKHAPGAPVTLALTVAESSVLLRVDSAGAPGTGSGLGVTGMAERADALGGRCTAGPGGQGWLVTASLPLGAGTPRGAQA
jgi:signal transduction histidine kinase